MVCPVLLNGRCNVAEEVLANYEEELTSEEFEELKDLYGLLSQKQSIKTYGKIRPHYMWGLFYFRRLLKIGNSYK
jgi:hypothetical protein